MDRVFAGNLRSIWANYRVNPHMLRPWSTLARGVFRRYRHNPLLQFKVLCGQYVRLLSYYRKYKRPKSDYLIVKFIRANLMIGWLAKNYDIRIVLVVRHPAAVISSRLRLIESSPTHYWGFDVVLQQYREDEHLREDYLYRYDDILHRPLSAISALTVIWCIENILPIIKAQKAGHCVVFYEDLIENPKALWDHMVHSLGLNAVPRSELLVKPSQQTSILMKKSIFGNDTQLTKWRQHLSEEQLLEIDKILNIFNVNIYSALDPMPISRIQAHENLQ
jgi:hypothetical protein